MAGLTLRCFSVTVVIVNLDDHEPRVLLLRRQDTLKGAWCPVSGSIEAGELAWKAGLREMYEETGLVPDTFYAADLSEVFYDIKREQISMEPVFVAFVTETDVVLNLEHSDHQWVSFQKAADLVPFPKHRRILLHVENEFLTRQPPEVLKLPTQIEI